MAEETPTTQPEEMVTEETPEETQVSEETESVESEETSEEETPEDDSSIVKSERGQKRIQELANKAKQAETLEKEVEDLRSRLVEEPKETSRDVIEELKADGIPYTGDYVQDLRIAEDRGAEKALRVFEERQQVREQFTSDINSLENSYPELKKGSESFDEDLTHEIVSLYKEASSVNPKLRLKSFVDKVMKVRKQGETKGKTVSVEEIASQENESAIKPTGGVKRVNKDPKEMSLEELEQIVPR